MRTIKKEQNKRLIKRCEEDSEFANDMISNNTKIVEIIYLQYLLEIIEIILITLNIAYILGMLWIVFNEAWEDMVLETNFHEMEATGQYDDYFMVKFGFIDKTIKQNVITSMYFAFTTLSTVGFGDFYPISDAERAVGAFILFVGVMIFSFVIGFIIEKFDSFLQIHKDFDDSYEL